MARPKKLVWFSSWKDFECDYMRHGRAGDLRFILSMHPLWGEPSDQWRAVLDFGDPASLCQDVYSRADGLRGAFQSAVEELVLPALARRDVLLEEFETMTGMWQVQAWLPGAQKWMDIVGAAGRKSYAQGYYDGLRSLLPRTRAYRLLNDKGEEVERCLTAGAPSVPRTGDRARLDRAAREGWGHNERFVKDLPHDPRTRDFLEYSTKEVDRCPDTFPQGVFDDETEGAYIMDCWFALRDEERDHTHNNPPEGA